MRLLLVEDDRRIAADVKAALEAAGYVVEVARDGDDAWFKGDTEDYGAIVLDLGLPGMDGLSVLKRWRANGRQTPVLVLTAREPGQSVSTALTQVQMIICRSRFKWRSCSPGCAPSSGVRRGTPRPS